MLNLSSRTLSVALLSESFFCGVLTILFGVSVYVVLFRRARTRTTYVLLVVNIVLYSISVLHWISNSVVILGIVSMGRAATLILIEGLPVINYVLCDAVVVWRAWLIWERNTKICIPSFVCLVGTLASALISVITQDDTSLALASLVWGFLLASNLWSTSIIAWRAWRHRQFIKAQMGEGTARTKVEKILGILIESGAVYCFIWSLYILIFYTLRSAAFIPAVILDQLVAIYPLTIIIIVHIRATSSDLLSQIASLDFVKPHDISSGNPDSTHHSIIPGSNRMLSYDTSLTLPRTFAIVEVAG